MLSKLVLAESAMPGTVNIKNKKRSSGGAKKNFLKFGAPSLLTENITGIKKDGNREKELPKIIKTIFKKRRRNK